MDPLVRTAGTAPGDVRHPTVHPQGFLRGVDPGVLPDLVGQLRIADFTAGQTIFSQGDSGDRAYSIGSGKVKLTLRGPDDRESVRAVLGPGDILGELAVFDPGPRSHTATAITDVRATWLDRHTLRAWMVAHPTIAEQLLEGLARRLRRTDSELIDLVSNDVGARVARQLLLLAGRFGVPDGDALRVLHGLTQSELAQLIGAERASVNRALQDFVTRGWLIVGDRSVLILDLDALAGRAGADPNRPGLSASA